MQSILPRPAETQVEFNENEALSSLSRTIVRASFEDALWEQVLEQFNLVNLVAELKRIVLEIGQEESRRAAGMSLFRSDPDVSNAQFRGYKANFLAWKRSSSRVRDQLRLRIAEVQPRAQAIINAHQADRRALVILAKRIWLWEEGLEDRLEYALDDVQISWTSDDGYASRRPLRDLVEDILDRDGEVTP